jgi:hypothetical protein
MDTFNEDLCPIKLEHIATGRPNQVIRFVGAFDWDTERECCAYAIIVMLQERERGFDPFTAEELEEFSATHHYWWVFRDGTDSSRVIAALSDYLAEGPLGYQVTLPFVARCFGYSPASQICGDMVTA